jgi:hypothetical protein
VKGLCTSCQVLTSKEVSCWDEDSSPPANEELPSAVLGPAMDHPAPRKDPALDISGLAERAAPGGMRDMFGTSSQRLRLVDEVLATGVRERAPQAFPGQERAWLAT